MRVLRQFFFHEKISHTQKKNYKKHKTSNKRLSLRCFLCGHKAKKHKKHKSTKRQTSNFLLLRFFYAYKNTVFFVHIKSIKKQISK